MFNVHAVIVGVHVQLVIEEYVQVVGTNSVTYPAPGLPKTTIIALDASEPSSFSVGWQCLLVHVAVMPL